MTRLITCLVTSLIVNFALAKPEFSFKNLYSTNSYVAMDDYGSYNPESAIASCPNLNIWPSSPDLPKEPLLDCGPSIGISSQLAYGCDISSHTIGINLARSVVGIFYPITPYQWRLRCTGTIIDKHWILTAAHCVAKAGVRNENNPDAGQFMNELKSEPLMVVPWQPNKNIVPTEISDESQLELGPYKVKAIYIPYHFNFFDEDVPTYYYIHADYALLELDHNLPDVTIHNIDHWFRPITLGVSKTKLFKGKKLWVAGYGNNENQIQDGKLRYRDEYLFSAYDLEQITVTGTMPTLYHDSLSAWKFISPGDSGGPILDYTVNKMPSIVGVISSGNCKWGGFFAPENEALSYAVNIPNYNAAIGDIMHNTAARSWTRCMSSSGGCAADQMIYIPNYNYNSISINHINRNTGEVSYFGSPILTGTNPFKIIFDKRGAYAYVINVFSNSISMYQVKQDGNLSALEPNRDIGLVTRHGTAVDITYYNGFIYVLSAIDNSVNIYKQNTNGKLTLIRAQYLDGREAKSLTISNGFAYITESGGIFVYSILPDGELFFKPELSEFLVKDIQAFKFGKGRYSKLAFVLKAKTIAVYIKEESGKLSFISETPSFSSLSSDIEFSDEGNLAFISHAASDSISIFIVKTNGQLETAGNIKTKTSPLNMSIDPSGRYLLVTHPSTSLITEYQIGYPPPYLHMFSEFVSRGYTPTMIATLPK